MKTALIIHNVELETGPRATINVMLESLIKSGSYIKSIRFVKQELGGHEYETLEIESENISDQALTIHQLTKD